MFSYKSYFMGAYQVLPATEKDAGADQAKIQGKRGFRCKFCGEKFKHSADLKLHQINHQKEEYPYSCKRCKKSFSRLSGISLHDCKKAQFIYQDSKLLETVAQNLRLINGHFPTFLAISLPTTGIFFTKLIFIQSFEVLNRSIS